MRATKTTSRGSLSSGAAQRAYQGLGATRGSGLGMRGRVSVPADDDPRDFPLRRGRR